MHVSSQCCLRRTPAPCSPCGAPALARAAPDAGRPRRAQAQQAPEVLRVPLQALCLTIKAAVPGARLADALGRLLTPPAPEAVASAVGALRELGALGADEALTPLGRHLARLPCDARLGKALLYGAMLRRARPRPAPAPFALRERQVAGSWSGSRPGAWPCARAPKRRGRRGCRLSL